MVHPTRKLSALFDVGSLWRMTTADAVYFLPAIPVLGTAGHRRRLLRHLWPDPPRLADFAASDRLPSTTSTSRRVNRFSRRARAMAVTPA